MENKNIQGIDLGRAFFQELVEPILAEEFPELSYAAGIIGSGSEVLGFDDDLSTDHHWGPRTMLFLSIDELKSCHERIRDCLSGRLPYSIRGYSTNFTPPDPDNGGTQLLQEITEGPVNHRVEAYSLNAYCLEYLGIEHDTELTPVVWLTIPGQKLRAFTGGEIYRDDKGDLSLLRRKLVYYPYDIWLYLMAAGWARIGQEEHFLGRTGYVGDELGSRLIGARLIHDLMNLCFLMEKTYPPFSKWFGSAFKQLKCSGTLEPIFQLVLDAADWQEREKHVVKAYEIFAKMHNQLGITKPHPVKASQFHGRPFRVIQADQFVSAIKNQIRDPEVKRISELTLIGAVEQFSTSTDVLSDTEILARLKDVYRSSDQAIS